MFLYDIDRIISSRCASLTACSQATAAADLNALVEDNVIIRRGAGINTRYLINPSLKVIQHGTEEGMDYK